MSRIDTTSFANSYLGGANLGTSQFGMLANIMQAMARQGLAERQFTETQSQNEINNNQWERNFGRLNENDVFDQGMREDNYRLDLGNQDISRSNLALRQGEFDLRTREDARREQRRALDSKVYATMARSILDRSAASRAMAQPAGSPMQGPPTSPGGQVGQVGQQMGPMAAPASSPEDDQWRSLIDSLEWSGDAEALGEVMPFLLDERKRAEQLQLMRALTDDGVLPEAIPDDTPQNRATKSVLKAFQSLGRPEQYLQAFGKWMDDQAQPRVTPELAAAFGLPPSMIGTPWSPAANQMATQNRALQKMQPQGKPGTILYNPGGNKNKTKPATVSIGGGQPLVWDPSNPDVQQFLAVAQMGMPEQDAGKYDRNNAFVDAISLGFAGQESDDEYNARVDKYARQLASTAQWVVHEPGGAPASNDAAVAASGGAMTPVAPVERIQQVIGSLKAQGLTPQQIKQRLTEMGLVR